MTIGHALRNSSPFKGCGSLCWNCEKRTQLFYLLDSRPQTIFFSWRECTPVFHCYSKNLILPYNVNGLEVKLWAIYCFIKYRTRARAYDFPVKSKIISRLLLNSSQNLLLKTTIVNCIFSSAFLCGKRKDICTSESAECKFMLIIYQVTSSLLPIYDVYKSLFKKNNYRT